ncbi:MAG: NosD domain-containing protein [Sedimentitalea sp.]
MAQRVISTSFTGQLTFEKFETVLIAEGVDVTGTPGVLDVMTRATSDDNHVTLIVDGTVSGDKRVVYLSGTQTLANDNRVGNNTVIINESGSVFTTESAEPGPGGVAVGVGQGRFNTISNDGLLYDGYAAIWSFFSEFATITNTGQMVGELYGIALESNSDSLIENSGFISSEKSAIAAFSNLRTDIQNTGYIEGDNHAIAFSGGAHNSITNEGVLIAKSQYSAIMFFAGSDNEISISGLIEGGTGVRLTDASTHIENSGRILGTEFGIRTDGFDSELVRIINVDLIVGGNAALQSISARIDLQNTGRVIGDVNTGAYSDRVLNDGRIKGDVDLSFGTDVYRAGSAGIVTGSVLGGYGDDLLLGGRHSDRLSGGEDNDRLGGNAGGNDLRGDAGSDKLRGGQGADRLNGGTGDDHLNGGAGTDVFVFGENSGADRIADFQAGFDTIEISGHAGGFASLTIQHYGAALRIAHDNGTIVLADLAGLTLEAADFFFS